jgi:hypothetical protein
MKNYMFECLNVCLFVCWMIGCLFVGVVLLGGTAAAYTTTQY